MLRNKIKNLFCLILITIFCGVSVFSQEAINSEQKLITEFIKLKNLKLVIIGSELSGDTESSIFDENSTKFLTMLGEILSKKGSIEVDTTGSVLIITDNESYLKLTKKFIETLDESGYTLEDLLSKKLTDNVRTEIIITENIFPIKGCYGYGGTSVYDPPLWANEQGLRFIEVLRFLLSSNGEILIEKRMAILTETDERITLFKKIIEVFDTPYLITEYK